MDRQYFLENIAARLRELGVSDNEMTRPMATLEKFLIDNAGELDESMDSPEEMEDMVQNMFLLIQKRREKNPMNAQPAVQNPPSDDQPRQMYVPAAQPAVSVAQAPVRDPGMAEPSSGYVQTAVRQEQPAPVQTPSASASGQAASQPVDMFSGQCFDEDEDMKIVSDNPKPKNDYIRQTPYSSDETRKIENLNPYASAGQAGYSGYMPENVPPYPPQPAEKKKQQKRDIYDDLTTISGGESAMERENAKGSAVFWLLFILTLPITFPLLLVMVAVFVALFAALVVMIVATILLLIGVIVAGTGLSLVGIIYGITQTFTVVPVGLYEIGLGIVIGGVSLLLGILLYNLAVRLLPWLSHMLYEFFCYSFAQLRRLFVYLKKESVKA